MSALIYNHVKSIGLSRARLQRTSAFVLRRMGESGAPISVSFVGEQRMRRLNRTHRGVDMATDVLSFPLREGGEETNGELGDIFLCPSYIRRQAGRLGVSYGEECTRMLIHGILHLAGHDHRTKREAKKMFGLQEKLLRDFQKLETSF